MRAARAVGNWEDAALTGWVCLALLVAAVVLPFVPWQPLLQLCGLALLGPHMWVVGRRVARSEARAAEEEQRFREARARRRRDGWWPQGAAAARGGRGEARARRGGGGGEGGEAAGGGARARGGARRALLSAASHTVVARADCALPGCRRAPSCSRSTARPLRAAEDEQQQPGAPPPRRAPATPRAGGGAFSSPPRTCAARVEEPRRDRSALDEHLLDHIYSSHQITQHVASGAGHVQADSPVASLK